MNKIRLNTIGEVVSKQSSSGGEGLQIKSVDITENGSKAITPDAGFGGLSKVVVNADVNTQQGLDFSEIYDQEQADEISQYYKDGLAYAKEIKIYTEGLTQPTSFFEKYKNDKKLIYFPDAENDKIGTVQQAFQEALNLEIIGKVNLINSNSLYATCYGCTSLKKCEFYNCGNTILCNQAFYNCYNLRELTLLDISKFNDIVNTFNNCVSLERLTITMWKQKDIKLAQSSKLSPESIHYIIQNAVDLADGATARTLTLHATAKTNWMNSKYYEEDEITRISKGITIA